MLEFLCKLFDKNAALCLCFSFAKVLFASLDFIVFLASKIFQDMSSVPISVTKKQPKKASEISIDSPVGCGATQWSRISWNGSEVII